MRFNKQELLNQKNKITHLIESSGVECPVTIFAHLVPKKLNKPQKRILLTHINRILNGYNPVPPSPFKKDPILEGNLRIESNLFQQETV